MPIISTLPATAGLNARLEIQTNSTEDIIVNVPGGVDGTGAPGLAIQLQDITASVIETTKLQLDTAIYGAVGGIEIVAARDTTAIPSSALNIYSVDNNVGITTTGGDSYGIRITETGTATGALKLNNAGVISTKGVAVLGGSEGDVIVNTREIKTTGAIAIDLGKGNDFYDGRSGTVVGKVVLGEGNDTAYGGASSETFSGGAGDDTLDGGGSTDTVDYSDATSGLTVDLAKTIAQLIGGGQGQDLLLNIENVIGGTFADALTGDNGSNWLIAGQGDDTLLGGLGDDTLDGGEGANDTVRYSGSTGATVSLLLTTAQDTGYGKDILIGIENLEGGSGADKLTGNDAANKLTGNSGSDTLEGGKGNDTLYGGGGNDWAVFTGKRSDYAWTSTTASDGTVTTDITDNVSGRDGADRLVNMRFLRFTNGTETTTDDEIVALKNGAPTGISLSVSSVRESVTVGSYIGSLSGTDPDGDTLTYTLLPGSDPRFKAVGSFLYLDGVLDYETAASHQITVKAVDAYGGEFVKTLTIGVTNVVETTGLTRSGTAGDEELVGENGNDQIFGLGGNDRLFGLLGNDTLYGGDGNDVVVGGNGKEPSGNDKLYGNLGADQLYGGDGQDIFVFDTKLSKANIDTILDFKPADDTIYLSRAIFKKAGKVGFLKKADFVVGSKIKDTSDHIVYQKTTGALFYDADGTGKIKPIQFATIEKNLHLTYKDFFIV